MDLNEFLEGNDRIDFVQVITFPHFQPRFVGLIGPNERISYVTTEMLDIAERMELGILISWSRGDPAAGSKREVFPGGRLLSFDYLAAPGFDLISGVRIRLDIGEMIITAGDMPYSIFMSLGEAQRGRPEYPVDQYRSINPA